MNTDQRTRVTKTIAATKESTTKQTNFSYVGSTKMYSMYEALARERMREQEQRSRQARLVRQLAAERRWHRVSLRAQAAAERHGQRARRVGQVAVR
jgi:hypothetical protein